MAAAGAAAPSSMMGEASTGGLPATPTTGAEPKIPAAMGECPEFKNGTMMIGGHSNIMVTAGPAGKKGALLFYWHGTGSSAEGEVSRLPKAMVDDIISTGGIIAGFNGSGTKGGKGDCSGTAAHNMADFDSADQVVACAVSKHGIDPRRIYSAGCSAGGLQTGCMAMVRSSYLAAVAPNSGGIVSPQMWQDMHSPAVMTMHGGASDMVIVTFSQTSASFDMNAKMHGSFVINCDHGGGHCAASDELKTAYWLFMKDHPFGIEKSPWATAIPAGVPEYCKVY
jgi:poly(3-hydroxybutyrate) depolymerase